MMSLRDQRAVRIMCDYCAEGVWGINSGGAWSVEELPVSQPLRSRILAWQKWHDSQDATLDRDPSFDVDGFTAEGLAIARAVKGALPDWTVVYFDEAACQWAERGAPRWLFEYEIPGKLH